MEKRFHTDLPDYNTGHLLEDQMLGVVNEARYMTEYQRQKEFEKEPAENSIADYKSFIENTYATFDEALNIARRSQPEGYDPADPNMKFGFANDLHAVIAEKLSPEDYSKLKLYTAVNSHLDIYHSSDAFFELETSDPATGRKFYAIVTLDVTLNPQKREGKADVTFTCPKEGLDRASDPTAYISAYKKLAEQIEKKLEVKIKDGNLYYPIQKGDSTFLKKYHYKIA